MKKITCFVIEDDPITLLWMKSTLSEFKDVDLVGTASTKEEAIEGIERLKPDLLLADIELDNCTTFDVLDGLISTPEFGIIFISSHQEYALRAIKVNAVDYISKPVSVEELRESINLFILNQVQKLKQFKKLLLYLENNKNKKRISVPMNGYTELINLEDIIYFKADVNYCHINIKDIKSILVSKPLKEFAKYLIGNDEFIRIHQSYLINKEHIKKIIKTKLPQVEMTNGHVLTVSRSNKSDFLKSVIQ